MGTVGRLKEGDLLLAGEVNERLPAVTNGLVAHFPFDGTARGDNYNPIMDYSVWKDGQVDGIGSFGGYSSGNSRITALDPWGNLTVVWKSVPNGGIYHSPVPIDNTKLYRMTWWEKRVTNAAATYGRYYAGLNGYGSTNGVCNLGSGTYNTNPYFWSTNHTGLTEGEWFLFVGHVFPHNHTGTSRHPDSGIYRLGGAHTVLGTDYKWGAATTTARSRTLAVYQGDDSAMEHHTVYPRMEICDGTEPTIDELLTGENNIIHPGTNSNTNFTPNGISIDEGTTNLISYDALPTDVGYDATAEESLHFVVAGTKSFKMQNIQATDLTYRGWRFNTEIGKRYVASFYVYDPHDVIYQAQLHDNSAEFTDKENTVEDCGGGYKRFISKGTASETAQTSHGMIFYFQQGNTNPVWVSGAQIENKSFPTAPADGYRSGGALSLENVVPITGEYTVHFKIKNNTVVGNPQGYASVMSMGNYYSNNSWTIMDSGGTAVGGSLGFIRKGNAGEWGWATTSLTSSSDLGKYISLTIVRDATSYKCYNNGILKGSIAHSSMMMQDLLWVGSRQSGSQIDGADFKDLSIYNRALTEEEVAKLNNNNFSIAKEGEVKSEIKEQPVKANGAYSSLSSDVKSESQEAKPSLSNEEAYHNGAVWVGRSTTNVATGTLTPYAPYNTLERTGQHLEFTMTGANYLTVHNGTDYNGQIITLSGYMRKNGLPHALPGNRANTYHSVPAPKWHFDAATGYFEIVENCNAASVWLFHTPSGAVTGDIITIDDFQVEQKDFASPLTNGSRGSTSLHYNLHESLGLDWSGSWSIVYWKKPIATHTDNLSGYSIDSLGSNSNSVGGGYIWWGKTSGSNTISAATPGTITPSDYFGKWRMISLVKSGTTLTIKEWESDGVVRTRTVSVTTSLANYYVNHYGYDFKVGGWDNTNVANGYFRDLLVSQTAFSDSELSTLHQTQMRASKDKPLQIQGQIKESEVL